MLGASAVSVLLALLVSGLLIVVTGFSPSSALTAIYDAAWPTDRR